MPPKAIMIAMTNPVPGREHDFDPWYRTHMSELLRLESFNSGKRYRAMPNSTFVPSWMRNDDDVPAAPYEYVAIYELTGEIEDIKEEIYATAGDRTPPNGSVADESSVWILMEIDEADGTA
jgi:hypothetical protein